jgi:hypothetical protein
MKSHKRELRKTIQLTCLATEEVLIESLNGDASLSVKARERLTSLIALIQQAESLDARSADQERENLVAQINRKLVRYRWSPEMENRLQEPALSLTFSYHTKTLEEQHENWCVRWIAELVRQRGILRVRRCAECRRWLWAVRDHQKHCSENCRKQHASRSPIFKEKRRLYMAKYRRDEKARSAAALARARKGKSQ